MQVPRAGEIGPGLSPVGIVRGVQGLMDVANEVNQKRELADRAPFVVVPFLEAPGVLVDLRGYEVPLRASSGYVAFLILQADVDEMPGRGPPPETRC